MCACVIPKVLYALETTWLRKGDRKRLDSFQVRCPRRVHGIGHAYWSRVPNAEVLRRAAAPSLTTVLTQRQLKLFGRIACMDDDAPERTVV